MAVRRKELLLTSELLVYSLGRGLARAKREGAKHTARFWASIYIQQKQQTYQDKIAFHDNWTPQNLYSWDGGGGGGRGGAGGGGCRY